MEAGRCLRVAALVIAAALRPESAAAFDTWVAQRDRAVVRQSLDYSCGLAALATVLSELGPAVSEASLLGDLGVQASGSRPGISFADLSRLARERGFRARGVAVRPSLLPRLRGQSVIIAMTIDGRAHFSVLREASEDGAVWLADPSWGNRRLAAWEFERYFVDEGGLGRLLLIAPAAPSKPQREGDVAARHGSAQSARDPIHADHTRSTRASARPPWKRTSWRWPVHLLPN
ncbi:MAG: cysteine peptidase family C39 domain-containing protein [Halieaceae bacterium]|nr:cysteine peptidase family C39 domain-containing protein [Halieaceae bacterium]